MLGVHVSRDWIPVVSGAVGAGGAVLAQIVSAYFTGRRETKAATARRREARVAAFTDEKRDLFLQILQLHDQQVAAYEELIQDAAQDRADIFIPTGVFMEERWKELSASLDLLAPEVVRKVEIITMLFSLLDSAIVKENRHEQHVVLMRLRTARYELRDKMRVSLGVDDGPDERKLERARKRRMAQWKRSRRDARLERRLEAMMERQAKEVEAAEKLE